MAYEYSDPRRASQATALPDVEVFHQRHNPAVQAVATGDTDDDDTEGSWYAGPGYYFAFGFPGCLWDGDPEGPYETYEQALEAARDLNGEQESVYADDEDTEQAE